MTTDTRTRPLPPIAARAQAAAAAAWHNLPRDTSRRTITPWDGYTGRTYRDPGLGGVIAFFLAVNAVAGLAGLAMAGWF